MSSCGIGSNETLPSKDIPIKMIKANNGIKSRIKAQKQSSANGMSSRIAEGAEQAQLVPKQYLTMKADVQQC